MKNALWIGIVVFALGCGTDEGGGALGADTQQPNQNDNGTTPPADTGVVSDTEAPDAGTVEETSVSDDTTVSEDVVLPEDVEPTVDVSTDDASPATDVPSGPEDTPTPDDVAVADVDTPDDDAAIDSDASVNNDVVNDDASIASDTGQPVPDVAPTTDAGAPIADVGLPDTDSGSQPKGPWYWESMAGPGVGKVLALEAHPDDSLVVLAGTNGGIYRTDSGGSTGWKQVNTGLDHIVTKSLGMDAETETWYAGTNGGIYRSKDDGVSWTFASTGLGGLDTWNGVTSIAVAAKDRIYAGTAELYVSTDGAESWSLVGKAAGGIQSVIELADEKTVLVGTFANGIWKSTGGDFTQVHPPKTGGIPVPSSVSDIVALSNGTLLAADYSFFKGDATLIQSTDGGNTWSQLVGGGLGEKVLDLVVHPQGKAIYAASKLKKGQPGTGAVYVSTNSGKDWLPTKFWGSPAIESLAVSAAAPDTLYVGGVGAWQSLDGAVTKTAINKGLGAATVAGLAVNPQGTGAVYAGTVDQCLWQKAASDMPWTSLADNIECGVTTGAVALGGMNPSAMMVATGSSLKYSVDGGQTFETKLEGLSPFKIKVSRLVSNGPIYAACGMNGIYKSLDGGVQWGGPYGDESFSLIQDLDACDTDPNVVYAAINDTGRLYRSANAGATWKSIGSSFSGIGKDVAVAPKNPQHVVAHMKDQGLFVSQDGGETWTPSIPGVVSSIIREVKFLDLDGKVVGVATEEGFYASVDGGNSFSKKSMGLGPAFVRTMTSEPTANKAYIGVVGAGVWETHWMLP